MYIYIYVCTYVYIYIYIYICILPTLNSNKDGLTIQGVFLNSRVLKFFGGLEVQSGLETQKNAGGKSQTVSFWHSGQEHEVRPGCRKLVFLYDDDLSWAFSFSILRNLSRKARFSMSNKSVNQVEEDVETPMWKLAFREKLESDSAYWNLGFH